MKKIVILGAGAGGTMLSARLMQKLDPKKWQLTIIDNDPTHHYQAGWFFIPFGLYRAAECKKPKKEFLPQGVRFILDEIIAVDPAKRRVSCNGGVYEYDWLVIATGCRIAPEEVDGLEAWHPDPGGNVHTFFTLDGALALSRKMRDFKKGRLVFNIAEMPHKCSVVPIEYVFMADWFYTVNGVRKDIEIRFVTPNTGIFTKPVATSVLSITAEQKGIHVTPNFHLLSVDTESNVLISADGRKEPYDLLVSTMPNFGARFIEDSGMGDGMGYVFTDHHTLKARHHDRIYVLGDATNVPTSKAGSVAHYESEIVAENLLLEIEDRAPKPAFDGHATCFIMSGYNKAFLFDYNYETEPLIGKFPFPGIGPFDLVGESHVNYWGKQMFKWAYWHLLLRGQALPLEPIMNMSGKIIPSAQAA